ncbi:prolyl-tRNA editing enzyme YbaK/EbsC (Cys-tRNA(Pro) deacylase) [Hoeflea marina]|uniref:Prolyl-tRNA editing enzyme YbaK/EbsC (Cys-tRNA(Pro) deacylase) n=1 Tax=Hoeflea marina TaxID=274592 RepID=A0A317PSA8_9HYPH|nr:YbaK/EbsC family protein [Hoeflea marina]PWW03837.1 prolyl-tRNA editing enzyme YbaK/EbsC (Cys-tRNA(Pro) deacylase) [Hoeflea marina]
MARVADAARTLGLDISIWRMADSTRTAEEAASACGCATGQIVKSLIFENADTRSLALLLVAGNQNADMDYLSARYGLNFARCDARRVRDETGFAIGGVAPFGHRAPLGVHIDRTLLDHAIVWAAAGRPDSVFSVEPKALARAIGAVVIDMRDPVG